MALQNDPRMFSGGYERVNTRPHVQLYAQLKAREQAKNDAFDEYMRNLNLKINTKGMRNQEIPAFNKMLQDWQASGIQDREAIQNPRKDGGLAAMKFQAGYQGLLNLASESQTAAEGLKPFIEVSSDPNKAKRLKKEKAMEAVQLHDQPILIQDETGAIVRNDKRRPFSPTDIEFNNDPFDLGKFRGLFKDIPRQELPPIIGATDPSTMTRTVTKRSVFDDQAKNQIAEIGVTQYMTDPSTKEFIDQLNPDEYNDIHKKAFGTDIQDGGDLAAAYALKQNQEEVVKTDVKDDEMAKFRAQEAIRQANREKNMRRANDYIMSRQAYRDSKNAKIVDEYVMSQYNDPTSKEGIVSHDGQQYKGRFVKVPSSFVDKYSVNKGTKDAPNWVDPQFFMTDDGKYVIPVYRSGTKSKSGWDDVYKESKPINMADWKIQISNDWIKNNRTANELADEFDVEGEVNESSSETNIRRTSTPTGSGQGRRVYKGIDKDGNPIFVTE